MMQRDEALVKVTKDQSDIATPKNSDSFRTIFGGTNSRGLASD
jgi:hypothetical protein